jgi:tetratricopeptide (TPR) repeat protein
MDPAALRRRSLLLAAAVAVITTAVFLPTLWGEFLNWDDDANFLGNPRFRGLGPEQLTWMFSDFFGHYMPLTWLTLGLDYVLWGMNPLGYHLTSVLFHAANSVLCFHLLRSVLRRARPDAEEKTLAWAAAGGALFFSLHPLRVESVAWITERRDVTSGFFFLLTTLAYLRGTEESPGSPAARKWLALSLAAFAASILCKAMGMTLPLVLLVIDAWPLKRFGTGKTAAVFREKIPYFALMAAGVLLTGIAQRRAGAIYSPEDYPLVQSLAQPGYRVSFYALKTLLPFGLSPLYFYQPALGLAQGLGWLAVAGVTFLVLFRRREAPWATAVWVAYGLLIAPVCGLVQAGPHFAADRYTYLACLPFAALAAGALTLSLPRLPLAVASTLLLAGLAGLTLKQSLIWRNSTALWSAAIRIDPDVYYTWYHRGRAKAASGDLEGAIADFTRAIDLRSGFPDPWRERGRSRARQGRHDLAAADLEVALRLEPQRAELAYDLGLAEVRAGKPQAALGHFSRALELRPDFPEATLQRARLSALSGDLTSASADLDGALRRRPTYALHFERGTIRAIGGNLEGAVADYTEAIRLKPDEADAYARRGVARLERQDRKGAIEDFGKALEIAPAGWPARRFVEQSLEQARKP